VIGVGPHEDNDQSLLNSISLCPRVSRSRRGSAIPGDPNGFATALATRYFSVTSAALHLYDPHHLNLGVKAESNDISA